MVVRILDHVDRVSTYDDGNVIFALIAPDLRAGKDVVLSFDGIDAVPSAFVNASVVQLAEELSVDVIRQHLKIISSTRQINELIRSRFGFVGLKATGATPA